MNILGLIPLAIFVLCCALIVWVLAQLARQGDERRKMIVGKACANTFLVMVVYLIACVVVDMVGPARAAHHRYALSDGQCARHFLQQQERH